MTDADFERDLCALLNRYNMESGSDTPDFMLANYLRCCLDNYNACVRARERWYGRDKAPTGGNGPEPTLADFSDLVALNNKRPR